MSTHPSTPADPVTCQQPGLIAEPSATAPLTPTRRPLAQAAVDQQDAVEYLMTSCRGESRTRHPRAVGRRAKGGILLLSAAAAAITLAGCGGNSPRPTVAAAPASSAASTTTAPAALRASAVGYGPWVEVTYQGFPYEVRAAAPAVTGSVPAGSGMWPDGISAAPGNGYILVKVEVANPLGSSEPITPFDDGAGNVNAVIIVAPSGDPVPAFGCNSTGLAATSPSPGAPAGCNVDLEVQNDSVVADHLPAIPAHGNAGLIIGVGPVPSSVNLGELKLYFYDPTFAPHPVQIPLP
jgi:hypothetical protein